MTPDSGQRREAHSDSTLNQTELGAASEAPLLRWSFALPEGGQLLAESQKHELCWRSWISCRSRSCAAHGR